MPLARTLSQSPRLRVELVHYRAGEEQPKHVHPRHQLSFLLAGGFAECVRDEVRTPLGPHHRFHPAGTEHAVRFGSRGAVLLALNFQQQSDEPQAARHWRPSAASVGDLARLLLFDVAPADEVLDGLLAATTIAPDGSASERNAVPPWLHRAAQNIADDPAADIADIAAQAGVHRVHLSRSFQRSFGVSPTQYRLYSKCSLALQRLIEYREPPAVAAQSAGFADQSHWTRASRAIAGIGPGRWRRLLAR